MKKSSLLLILLIWTLTLGRVYTLSVDDTIRGDYFYTLATMLEDIPELDIRVLDATDTDIYRLGGSGREDRTVALFVDGVKHMDFQDGSFNDALRSIANNAIDSIIVYTGFSAAGYPGNYAVVIDVIPQKEKGASFIGGTYVGSEVGDPAIYLHLLEGDKPYNKEQLASGELWGAWGRKRLKQDASFVMSYMDRYSNAHEAERSLNYGLLNSDNSLCEVRKGTYGLSFLPSQKQRFSFTVSAMDYNLFRFDTYDDRYRFYRGRRGGALLQGGLSGEKHTLSVGLQGSYEQSHHYESQFDSTAVDWGSVAYTFSLELPQQLRFYALGEHEFGKDSSENPYQTLRAEEKSDNSFLVSKGAFDSSLTIAVGYPLQAQLQMRRRLAMLTLHGGVSVNNLRDSNSDSFVQLRSELFCDIETKGASSFSVGFGVERGPFWQGHYLSGRYEESCNSYWGSLDYALNRYFRCYLYGSNYHLKGGVLSSFSVRGLKLAGGVQIKSKSYWDGDSRLLSFKERDSQSVSVQTPTVRGTLRMSYALFQDHLRVAIAIRDVGKVKKDLPLGSLVGPVIVSNILFRF